MAGSERDPDGEQPDRPRWAADDTAAVPPIRDNPAGAAPGGPPDDDATRALPPIGDGTAVLPPVADDGPWQARAEVPQRSEVTEQTQWTESEPANDRWWLPLVLGLVGLILLGLVGYGLWLLFGENDDPATPVVSPSATAAPTLSPTRSPSPPPSLSAPASQTAAPRVVVPDVTGLSRAEARERLEAVGLAYQLRYRSTGEVDPGTVLETDPAPGARVSRDAVVTLVIAERPPATRPSTTSPPASFAPEEPVTPTL
ncbi:PASTA domain-containing protein [Pilimelia columellifera]|uniref:PASTA domain-containing protein n=1 Tax=Pilimelia columellifera subsp. columellifera TaxID=706583 RepID=A0ABN3N0E5_9ACTN